MDEADEGDDDDEVDKGDEGDELEGRLARWGKCRLLGLRHHRNAQYQRKYVDQQLLASVVIILGISITITIEPWVRLFRSVRSHILVHLTLL